MNPVKKPRGRPFARGHDPRRRPTVEAGDHCPRCDDGVIGIKNGRYGPYLTCSRCGEPFRGDFTSPAPIAVAPATGAAAGSLDAIIEDIARRAASESINETRVREIIKSETQQITDALAGVQSQTKRISVNSLPPVTIEGAMHRALPRVVKLALARFNVLLVGPAGSGKTVLGEQLAQSLGRTFATISCAPGLPESAFIGRLIPNLSDGTESYRTTPFVESYRKGGVFMADEIDNADPSTVLILNSALSNGHLTVPSGERISRHDDFVLVASANTYGHGQSREYVGRSALDAAFLDRFVGSTISLDYDPDLERQLVPDDTLRSRVQSMRSTCRELKLRRIVSTRALKAAHTLMTALDDTLDDAMLAVTEGWTPEDRRAVGVQC